MRKAVVILLCLLVAPAFLALGSGQKEGTGTSGSASAGIINGPDVLPIVKPGNKVTLTFFITLATRADN